jgi:nickel-dependent lactate racemase
MISEAFEVALPYGGETLRASIDWARLLGVLEVADVSGLADPVAALHAGLESPIGLPARGLSAFRPGERVVIIVSDSFRQTGIHHLLPALLAGLAARGVAEADCSFVFSTGTHRGPTPEEAEKILGKEIYARFRDRAHAHDPFNEEELVHLGRTSQGTPVSLNRRVVEADRVILTGTVVLHYFGGYGGGRKSLVPGVAGVGTIAHNHARNLHPTEDRLNPSVRIGTLEGNPVAEDMAEGAAFCKVDLLINTVLNRHGAIAGVFVGDMVAGHAAACRFAHDLYVVPLPQQADVVIASAGSAKNFIQSHKALFNAFQALKPGGRIIFLAPAQEGFGGNKFTHWLELGSREAIIQELRRNAEINGQTALSTIEKAAVSHFVTELSEPEVRQLGGVKAQSLADALAQVRQHFAALGNLSPTLLLMPSASYTVPFP